MGFFEGNCFETEQQRVVREARQLTFTAAYADGLAKFTLDSFEGLYDPEYATNAAAYYIDAGQRYEPTANQRELIAELRAWNLTGDLPPTEDN